MCTNRASLNTIIIIIWNLELKAAATIYTHAVKQCLSITTGFIKLNLPSVIVTAAATPDTSEDDSCFYQTTMLTFIFLNRNRNGYRDWLNNNSSFMGRTGFAFFASRTRLTVITYRARDCR
jgi:hypothetical protein